MFSEISKQMYIYHARHRTYFLRLRSIACHANTAKIMRRRRRTHAFAFAIEIEANSTQRDLERKQRNKKLLTSFFLCCFYCWFGKISRTTLYLFVCARIYKKIAFFFRYLLWFKKKIIENITKRERESKTNMK